MKKIIFLLPILMYSCVVGPNFKSPEVKTPQKYIYDSLTKADTTSSITLNWWANFGDTTLSQLIRMAIDSNKNLAIAASKVEQARLKARSAKMENLPKLNFSLGADLDYVYSTKLSQQYSAMIGITWDIDLFGKYARMSEAAINSYFATEYGRRAAQLALSAEVATNYFALLQYKKSYEIASHTYKSRYESLILMDSMYKYGMISLVDLEQARASTMTAKTSQEQYDRAVKQTMLAINLLLSDTPKEVAVSDVYDHEIALKVPVGLPSSLLERRPDVMQAYYNAASANANIGVAIANRLPSLSLTGQGGILASLERNTTSGMPIGWSAAGSLLQPILNWGNNKRAVDIARQETLAANLNYQQTALNALNETELALVAVDTYNRELMAQKTVLDASLKAKSLTQELYKTGSASYLDLLDADRTLFQAQTLYWQTMQNYLSAYVSLYKALGGGW